MGSAEKSGEEKKARAGAAVAAGQAPPSNCRNRSCSASLAGVGAVAGGDGNGAPSSFCHTPPSFCPPASTSGLLFNNLFQMDLESIVRAVGAFIAPAVAGEF